MESSITVSSHGILVLHIDVKDDQEVEDRMNTLHLHPDLQKHDLTKLEVCVERSYIQAFS